MTSAMNKIPEFSVLIPARLESTRLPNKPLLDICGQPMIIHVAKQAKKSHAKQVIVATDSEQILSVCKKFNVSACITSNNHKNGTERIAEAVEKMSFAESDIIVNVQGDEPLIDPKLINSVAIKLNESPSCNIVTSACILRDTQDILNPNTVKVIINKLGQANYFSRAAIPYARDFALSNVILSEKKVDKNNQPQLHYYQHIGIYAYRAIFLNQYKKLPPAPTEHAESLEQLRALWHGEIISVVVTENRSSGGVDTPLDYERMKNIISQSMQS